jgi:bacteriorhodopsin
MLIESTFISIIIQFLTAIIDIYGIYLPVDDNFNILRELLQVELGVQTIELIFYIWLVFSIHSIKNITLYRYADWFITTPIMLITLMAYLSIEPSKPTKLADFINNNSNDIIYVVLLNAAMLLFGFLSELFPVHRILFVTAGFIPFIMYFYRIYKNYLQEEHPDVHPIFTRKNIFWYFVIVWSLYGIIAFFPYVIKNVGLNILDLFSKNAFGIMLVYILSYHVADSPIKKIITNIVE